MSGHKFLSASEAAELRGCTVDDIMRWVMEDHTLSAMLVSSRGVAVAFKLGGLETHTVNEAGQVTDLRTGKSAGNLRFEMAEIVRHLAEWAHAKAAAVQLATEPRPVTPAPAEVVGALAGADKGKKVETLAFEKAALGYMTDVWNDWKINRARDSSLKEPTKGVMHGAVLNKLNEAVIKGSRRTPTITMVSQATRPWQKPSVMNVQISPALAPKKRHVFKGDK